MFAKKINANQKQISTVMGKKEQPSLGGGGVACFLDTCADHMFFSALLQYRLIDNMLAWERRTACRGFRNTLSHGYLGSWCCCWEGKQCHGTVAQRAQPLLVQREGGGLPWQSGGLVSALSFYQDCHCSMQCKGAKLIPQVGSKWKEVLFIPQWQRDWCGDGCKPDKLLRRGMKLWKTVSASLACLFLMCTHPEAVGRDVHMWKKARNSSLVCLIFYLHRYKNGSMHSRNIVESSWLITQWQMICFYWNPHQKQCFPHQKHDVPWWDSMFNSGV